MVITGLKTRGQAMAAAVGVGDVDLGRWERELAELLVQVGGRCARRETPGQLGAMVRGMLAGLPRVNC